MQGVTVLQLLLIFDHALTAGNTVVKLWFKSPHFQEV